MKQGCTFIVALLTIFSVAGVQAQNMPAGYDLVYQLNIPTQVTYQNAGMEIYSVNNSSSVVGVLESVGYKLQLGDQWVTATMAPFTNDVSKIGLPTFNSGAVFQTYVNNLSYNSNNDTLNPEGAQVNVAKGNIEFWPNNYGGGNAQNIPNATDNFDFGDTRAGDGNHGSMQVHDYQNSTTVFAFNKWSGSGGGGQYVEIGIGNAPGANTDWTHSNSGNNYPSRVLEVYAKTVDMAPELFTNPTTAAELKNMNLVYKLDIPATQAGGLTTANYTINNADTVANALQGMPLKVGYYMELAKSDGTKDYVYTSMEGLTNNVAKTGLPFGDAYNHQKTVKNMTVQSNVAGVVNGANIATGNVEMWSGNYTTGNAANVPGANGSTYDFGDERGAGSGYASFQVHNYGASQTVFALNHWGGTTHGNTNAFDIGIGNSPTGNPDWTFNVERGNDANVNNYTDRKLYVMASAAIAPGMTNVSNADDYKIVQGARFKNPTTNANLHNGTKYDIVNNAAQMKTDNVVFDRVGYYMEYANTVDDDLRYVFVSMDAFTTDITKLGVPDAQSGIFYQQVVKNLEITSNVPSNEGILTTGKANRGYLEFWPTNYTHAKSGVVHEGSGGIYDINDTPTPGNHGSMQVHNLDKGETVFAINSFGGNRSFGIGTNPNAAVNTVNNPPQADWTFDTSRTGYEIANIYMFVRESDAALISNARSGYSMYQRDASGKAVVDISGEYAQAAGITIESIQFTTDGNSWTNLPNLQMNADGTFQSSLPLSTGWHDISLRAVDPNGTVLTSTSLADHIGVGEIFITAGQSNSTNCGDTPLTTNGNTVALDLSQGKENASWRLANDPQPVTILGASDGSTLGSTWAPFGDALSAKLGGVPIGIVSVGWSGSSLEQWDPDSWTGSGSPQPGNNTLFGRLEYAIEALDGNFAGILWHQGESNFGRGSTYQAAMEELIAASRDVANAQGWGDMAPEDWELPWLIALVSALGANPFNKDAVAPTDPSIIAAQQAVIENDLFAFLGPDSDKVKNTWDEDSNSYIFRGLNGNDIHFSKEGLDYMGLLWAEAAFRMIQARDANNASSATPEPATWVLMLLGFAALAVAARRKRKTAA